MKFRVDIGSIHGYIEGVFTPDDRDCVVINDSMAYREVEESFKRMYDDA